MNENENLTGNVNSEPTPEPKRAKLKFNVLHIILTVLFSVGLIASYFLTDTHGIVRGLAWFVATLLPFVVILFFTVKGLPKFFAGRFGAIILLILVGELVGLIPVISVILFILCIICVAIFIFRLFTAAAPITTVRVKRMDENGNIVNETRFEYGDPDLVMTQMKMRLYTDSKWMSVKNLDDENK